ncbi:MAG TPA: F0F1 ATP synthase subunit A [Opitutales bacterium]|nr:F0F1 ATP synthase subunit A [Opitutales bacterium]
MFKFRLLSAFPLALFGLLGLAPVLAAASTELEKLSPRADILWTPLGFPITNSMVTSWVIAGLLILLIRFAIKKPTLVPHRGQAMVEAVVQGITDLIEPIVGSRMVRVTFPLLAALFVYILIQNWSGLLPGVGTIGWGKDSGGGISQALIRPGHADMNTTLALAIVSMVAWVYYIIRYAGFKAIAYDLFGNKADRTEVPLVIFIGLFGVFFFVGLIEVISILFRPVSLSFRLFGNVFGGENLLHEMMGLFAWVVPIPFYGLEVLIGLVQALVFTLLVAVYIGLVCNHEEEGESN